MWIQYNSVNVKVMLIWVAQVSVSVNLLSAEGNRIYVRMIRYYKSLFQQRLIICFNQCKNEENDI